MALLDWFDLEQELVLVLERPVPCMELLGYVCTRGNTLPEDEAKVSTFSAVQCLCELCHVIFMFVSFSFRSQLVDSLLQIHSRGILYRDNELENVLIETGFDVPHVRLIDFGCGTFQTGVLLVRKRYAIPH